MDAIYFFLTIALAVGLTMLFTWFKKNNITLKWNEWVLGILGLLLALFAIQHTYASATYEFEYTSAWIMGVIVLLLAVVPLLFAARSVRRRVDK
ncbi:dehalogenase [Dehalococcoides sp. THU3]|uniref:VcrB n=3 Tax=environmental samples TaxID=171951 RepID=F8V4B9_9CHLR|nr:hypothetical protein [Dehalococcoides mccartyi]AEI59443.1 VcrB [Dehalococcoides sp. enrichment culture clone PM_Dhc_01]AEI59449.1 VcrB [Dehalococcoides sp. enrichment culture clone EV_Dhc_01]AEI59455.1 VcrB [Dehalococcoides sp. enrichment culture clone WL_Dhc_01]KSV17873.1 dehalogenase [Dehalococcoides mccartyi]OBW62401.1 MAG: dehalogenase [Dehalococcoides mccartyi]